jgi:hypothetical protein
MKVGLITALSVGCTSSAYAALPALHTTTSFNQLQHVGFKLPDLPKPPPIAGYQLPSPPPVSIPPFIGGRGSPVPGPVPGIGIPGAPGCNLPTFPTPVDIAKEVNKEALGQINTLNQLVKDQQQRLDSIHKDIQSDIVSALAAPFKALGGELGKVIKAEIDGTKQWLWDKAKQIVTIAAIVCAVFIGLLIGFPLRAFLGWALLGPRKRGVA